LPPLAERRTGGHSGRGKQIDRHAGILAAGFLFLIDRSHAMLKVGDKLPAGALQEYIEIEGEGCSIGPNTFDIEKATAGKKVVIFGLPGAYTPTCSAKHVPGFVQQADALKTLGVDEIWCVSVNDAFVMGAWGRDQKTSGKLRMMADGSADFAKATGLTLDLSARGMGLRCQRYSMLVDNGTVKSLNVEAPGKFEVSDADTMLKQARQLLA
jgi:glutaredoxin/glutathione-dependent peroxiredoxin